MRSLSLALIAGAATLAVAAPAAHAAAPKKADKEGSPGAVFVATNHNNTQDPSEPANQVAYYRRAADGRLTLVRRYDTGGQGSGPSQRFAGDGLGSGNSVWLSTDKRHLFVANAGSNSVTVFRVLADGLRRTDVQPTGNGTPGRRFTNSVAQHGNLVYVLNSGDDGSITGFRLDDDSGQLEPLSGSTRGLDANQPRFAPDPISNPTQVSFTPDGSQLVVSIKDGPRAGLVPGFTPTGEGRVLIFGVGRDGRPSSRPTVNGFDNRGPFGFSFDRRGNLEIAEFLGGGVQDGGLTAAAGSYRIGDDGRLTPITPAVGSTQIDTCWVVNNGRFAFGSNYGSGTITSWTIGKNGGLTLLDATAGTTAPAGNVQGSTPLDLRTSPNGKFLYNVLPGSGRVAGWRIANDGALTKLGEFAGLPRTVDGDHAPTDFGTGGSPAGIEVL